ncbi:MAG: hypothetical protein K2O33_03260, partial [Muribaculaceae bacterium]|nr:hypothetical protein [Muribaculaceae bacterium]
MKLRLFPLVAALVLAAGCDEQAEEAPKPKEPDYVTLEHETLQALPEGGAVAIRFQTNAAWKIELPNTTEHFYGMPHDREGDAGRVATSYTMCPNTTGKPRSTTLRIIAGRAAAELVVTQQPADITLPSEAEVRGYLMRLYDDVNGQECRFNPNWGSDKPLSQWGPEVRYENGLLTLNLGDRGMKGEINLAGCKALVTLRCAKNQIRKIDVSDCPLLKDIDCTNNSLEEIKLDGCLSLDRLTTSYNNLTTIDVGWSKTLQWLYVDNNRLTELDLSECVMLLSANCFVNRISRINIPHRQRLKDLFCYENELKALDIGDSPQIEILNCGDNEIESLNVRGCPRLDWIYCYNNRLTGVDTSDQKEVLDHFYCFSNRIESLDMTGYRNLSELHCSDNGMTSLTVAGCKNIRWLYCSYNRLETLDLTGLY